MHVIFQRHHIAPDDFMAKSPGAQAFMCESMKIQLEAEKKARDKRKGIYYDEDDEWEGGDD